MKTFVKLSIAGIETRCITRLAFLSRFTDQEAINIDLASQGDSAEAAAVRRYLSKINAATFVDLDRPDTASGVFALTSLGLISEERADAILHAAIADTERYRGEQ